MNASLNVHGLHPVFFFSLHWTADVFSQEFPGKSIKYDNLQSIVNLLRAGAGVDEEMANCTVKCIFYNYI